MHVYHTKSVRVFIYMVIVIFVMNIRMGNQ